jgi:hypothetical protein
VGLFNKMKDPVGGTANVVSATTLDAGASGKDPCDMQLIVQADGLSPTTIEYHDKVPVIRWPRAGDVLPVTVDRANPEHVEIDWDSLPVRGQALVATPVATPSAPTSATHSIRDEHPEIPPEAAEIVDKITSMFPGAQINVADPTVIEMDGAMQIPGMSAPAQDRISQLERLSKLHEEGALSDAEFETEKRRVLDGS